MRLVTEIYKVYKFNELPNKQKAIEQYWDINVDYEWWDFTYEDAERIGLKLTGFGLDRYRGASGDFTEDPEEVARGILADHGAHCETYKSAQNYLEARKECVKQQCQEDADFICSRDFDAMFYDLPDISTEDLDAEFLRSLLEDYAVILQNKYDYLTSEEAIAETLEMNEYEFTEDGRIY